MAGRTMTRFAAAVALTAAALSPGFALQPVPPTAPPPRPVPTVAPAPREITRETTRIREVFEYRHLGGVQPTVAPAPRPVAGSCDLLDHLVTAPAGPACRGCPVSELLKLIGPAAGVAPAPRPVRVGQEVRLVEIVCGPQTGACCAAAAKPAGGPLAGTWYRELPGTVLAFTFAADELKATATLDADGLRGCVTLTADYAVAKDGTVHGVVTGADVTASGGLGGLELVSVAMAAQEMVGRPFAFRAKPTAGGVMISNVRLSLPGELGGDETLAKLPNVAAGQYKPAAGVAAVPAPKAATGVYLQNVYSSDPNVLRLVQPAGGFGKCDSAANPADAVPAASCPPYPAAPCPGMQYAPPVPQKPCDADAAGGFFDPWFRGKQTNFGGMTLPSPRYLEHYPQYFAPDPAFPLPRELQTQEGPKAPPAPGGVLPAGGVVAAPKTAGGLPAGTWYRDLGPMRYVLKFHDGRMTVTATATVETDAGVVSSGIVWTADCYPTRDGSGVVGVVTSLDAVLDGPLPASTDADDVARRLPRVQKAVTGQPLAFTLRVDADALTVGEVRIAGLELKDAQDDELKQGLDMLGGRYRSAGCKPLPKPTPVKLAPNTVPSGPPAVLLPPPSIPYAMPLPQPGCLPAPPVVYGPPVGFPPGPALMPPYASPVPAPCPVMVAGGPPPDLIPATQIPPPPPAPRPGPMVSPAFAPSGIVGEWQRTAGDCEIGLTVTPDRITARATSRDEDRPLVVEVTADYKEFRDGQLVGVVTSVDARSPGYKNPQVDMKDLRAAVGMPFACRFRRYDNELVVTELRVADSQTDIGDLAVMVGRYTKDQPAPPTPAKAAVPPMAPAAPLPSEPGAKTGAGCPFGFWLVNVYSADPTERMRELLERSEDLRQIETQWRRFWFNDQPSHLTPERIHGGIR